MQFYLGLRFVWYCTYISGFNMSRWSATASALLLLWLVPGSALGEYTSQGLSTFVDIMLAEYDRESLPEARTTIALALDVRHATVDDYTSTMRLLADIKMSWNDTRLVWNASSWSSDSVVVPAERLWLPDIELVNAGGWRGADEAVLRARLSSSGSVVAVHRLALSVPLAMQLHDWPRDVQRAVFKFASRAHNQQEIDIILNDYTHSIVAESGMWEVGSVEGMMSTWQRGEEGDVPVATWTVAVGRRSAARSAAASSVLAAAVVMLLAAAALPYSQRTPLAAAAAFLAAMWLITAIIHLPAGASTPRVVVVMSAVCVTAAAAAACAAAATLLAGRVNPPPAPLLRLLSKLSSHGHALAPDPESPNGKSGAWRAVAQIFDYVVVALLMLTLFILCIVQSF